MRGVGFWLAIALVLGGIVHIAAMLVIPSLAPKSAYSRFEAELEPNLAVMMGPAVAGAEPFPFASPDLVYVVCRYDVAERPVRFTASLPDTYWSLALFEPDGGNFYHTNSIQSATGQPDLLLARASVGAEDLEPAGDLTVVRSVTPNGLILLSIFLRDRTLAATIERAARGAACSSFELGSS